MISLWKSVDEVLDYAIAAEIEAFANYQRLAGMAPASAIRDLFERLKGEEDRHRRKLLDMKKGGTASLSAQQLLKISKPESPKPELDGVHTVRDAYRLAIKAEEDSNRLYLTLGQMAQDTTIRETFQALAKEEQTHRKLLEHSLKEQSSAEFLAKPLGPAEGRA